jgi:uncharacterized protein
VGKLIFLLLLIAIVWLVVKNYLKPRRPPEPRAPEDMVRCLHCGVHLPRSESHSSEGKSFCSQEHLRLHR